MNATASDEHDLVAAAQAGDRRAFHDLYERHVETVYRYAAARVGAHDAEDVTSEVFYRAWCNIARYEDRGKPLDAWLVRIARNLLISHARRVWPALYDHTVRAAAPDGSFEEQIVTGLIGETVVDAMGHLDERHQTVLRLRYLEGRSVAEVARRMELTEEGVRALAYRALKALRALYAVHGLTGAGGI